MKYESVKTFNDNSKALTLITGIKDMKTKEVDVKVYQYPFYVEGIFLKKSLDLGAELEVAEDTIDADLLERLSNYAVELYAKQFTVDEFQKGVHEENLIPVLYRILMSVLQGDEKKA